MPIIIFVIAAFLVGMALGLFFRVFILIPAFVMSAIAIVAFGFQFRMTFGVTLLLMAMVVTAVQTGYLAGAFISVSAAKSKARKNRSDIEARIPYFGAQGHPRDLDSPRIGRRQLEVDRWMLELGGHFRAGLEEHQVRSRAPGEKQIQTERTRAICAANLVAP